MIKKYLNKKGSAIPLALFAVTLIMIVSIIFSNTLFNERLNSIKKEEKVVMRYVAEAGIEHALYEKGKWDGSIKKDTIQNIGYMGKKQYSYEIEKINNIISSRVYDDKNKHVFTLEAILNENGISEFKEIPVK